MFIGKLECSSEGVSNETKFDHVNLILFLLKKIKN